MKNEVTKINGVNVLVVDDEETICKSVEKIVNRMGFKADWTLNVNSALKKMEMGNRYDLVIADLMMPHVGGMEMLKIVRDRWPDVTMLIITGYATIPSAVEASRQGAAAYVQKPFTPEELEKAVKKAISKRKGKSATPSMKGKDSPRKGVIDVDMPFDAAEVEKVTSPRYVDQLTRSDVTTPKPKEEKPSEMFCPKGQRECKRYVTKGICQTEECPLIVAERKKAAKQERLMQLSSDFIDVDMPFDRREVAAVTGADYVYAMGRSDLPIVGQWPKEDQREVESPKILVVDDEPVVVNSIIKSLKKKHYVMDEAFTGGEAVKKVKEKIYDLILLDMKLPDASGLDLLGKLKELRPDVPIIIVTGYASIDTAVDAIQKGADEFMAKPFTPQEISIVTDRVLKQYAA